MHCFSGDAMLAGRYVELGFLVSLPASITYPSACDKVEIARVLPLDRLLVETDAPFLPPQLHRGQRNEPSYVSFVVDKIAEVRRVPANTIAMATAKNAMHLFRLPLLLGN
jgi:TatD DNase family protein